MKILYVLNPALEDYRISGAAMLPINLSKTLVKCHPDVEIGFVGSYLLYELLEDSNFKIYTPEVRKSRSILDTIEYVRNLYISEGYDIIHIHIAQMSVFSAINKLLSDLPVVYTQHNAGISGRFSLPYREPARLLSCSESARVILPSESMMKIWEDYIETTSHPSTQVIKNGIPSYPELRDESLPLNECSNYISVGRLEPSKGMAEIAELCVKYRHPITLVAGYSVGTVKLSEDMKAYIDRFDKVCKDNPDIITRYEYLPNYELRRLMVKSRGYLSLSTLESYGLAAAESIMSGLPVIFYEEEATKEFSLNGNSIMIPRKETYRKTYLTKLEIYEKYLQEYENCISSGNITREKVYETSKDLKLSIEDCADSYYRTYCDLID